MRRFYGRVVLLLVLCAAAVISPAARATSAIFLSESEQAARSTAVVVATVTAQRVERSKQYGRPITLTTVTVERTIYGRAPEVLTLEQFGGELDGMTTYVAGDASLAVGEHCVLFVKHEAGNWYLTAMEQSKYRIVDASDGPALYRELSSAYYRHDDHGALRPFDPPMTQSASLKELEVLLGSESVHPTPAGKVTP